MSVAAGWLADPSGSHEMRYWDGSTWTGHVVDQGVQAVEDLPPGPPPAPPTEALAPPPPPPAPGAPVAPSAPAAAGGGGWKDKLKSAAQQGKAAAEQARTAIGEQQSKRHEQYASDPSTLWMGESQSAAGKATGMSKAFYRITKDRIWIDTGVFGIKSEQVPLWSVKDVDVRQNVLQRGKDIGDVELLLEDPTLGVAQGGAFNMTGEIAREPGMTSGSVLLDNIEGPMQVRELLLPLISEARQKKLVERQSQYVHHVNPAMGMPGMAPQPAPAPVPSGPPVDVADQLRKLAELRNEGILSDDEFAAQKAKLLSS